MLFNIFYYNYLYYKTLQFRRNCINQLKTILIPLYNRFRRNRKSALAFFILKYSNFYKQGISCILFKIVPISLLQAVVICTHVATYKRKPYFGSVTRQSKGTQEWKRSFLAFSANSNCLVTVPR
jgi:hypothetical protein